LGIPEDQLEAGLKEAAEQMKRAGTPRRIAEAKFKGAAIAAIIRNGPFPGQNSKESLAEFERHHKKALDAAYGD
jgi:hypothetical protein